MFLHHPTPMSSQLPAAPHQVSLPYAGTALAPPSSPSRPGSSILIDCALESPQNAENYARRWSDKEKITNQWRRQVTPIEMLPDDVLLEVFHFHVDKTSGNEEKMKVWQSLVHVCRRWRSVVFGSPRRLHLRLVCTANTPARETVDVWPALPLLIRDYYCRTNSMDNIIALLEHSGLVRRITQIILRAVSSSHLEDVWEAMQVPFPELTHLELRHYYETEPVVPLSDSFLGGSAPQLRSLFLHHIPYPGLPKLLLSATHLTRLHLDRIPRSGYISPEAMVAYLSTLTSLEPQ